MFFGKLNDQSSPVAVKYSIASSGNGDTVNIRENGNPFESERMLIHWSEYYDKALFMRVSLSKKCFVDRIVITLDAQSHLTALTALDAECKNVFARYCAETGKTVSEETVALDICDEISELVIKFEMPFSSLAVKSADVYGAVIDEPVVYPFPVQYTQGKERYSLEKLSGVAVKDCRAVCASRILIEKIREKTGLTLEEAEDAAIVFAEDEKIPENGYRLSVCECGITVSASDKRGYVSGVECLIKLINGSSVPECDISDYPRMNFRGVHLMLPAREEFGFAERLIKYLISPMGYNYVILEFAGGMRFDSHPEINAAVEEAKRKSAEGIWPPFPHDYAGGMETVEKSEVAEFVDYIRGYGIEVIPEVQSLGHVQFMTIAHPEIAECEEANMLDRSSIDEMQADVPPDDFYPHSYCPSNEKSYEILFDLIDEIVEVVRPVEYVHMGHDEVYQIGICPKCRKERPDVLFARDVNRIHEYLNSKGLKMMIWADMLQPVTKYKTFAAIDSIPKDIVLLDFIWYFHMNDDIEDNLLSKGFNVIFGNMYSSHYPRYESRICKNGVIGAEVSTWVRTTEYELAKEGKLYDFLYSAQMLWSDSYTECLRNTYDKLVSSLIPELREKLGNINYPSRMKNKREFGIVNNSCDGNYKTGLSVKTEAICDSIVFYHAAVEPLTRIPCGALDVIGKYELVYDDGETLYIPVTYGGNTYYCGKRQNEPLSAGYYRHNGYFGTYFTDNITKKLPCGDISAIYRFEWINRKPDTKIVEINYIPEHKAAAELTVMRVDGIKII